MGVGVYLKLEKEIPGVEPATGIDGKALAHNIELLTRLATDLGVTPLENFVSFAPDSVADFFEDAGGDPSNLAIPPEEWFDASDALATTHTLLQSVQADAGGYRSPKGLIADLQACEKILQAAEQRHIRFHLTFDTP